MAKVNVIVELAAEPRIAGAAATAAFEAVAMEMAPALPGLSMDTSFTPVPVPRLVEPAEHGLEITEAAMVLASLDPGSPIPVVTSYIVRGEMEEEDAEALAARDDVVGVYADVAIQPMLICPGSGPLGSHLDVERLLCASRLRALGADGRSVLVAIVDTGVNIAYLAQHGKNPNFDAARSWVPRAGLTPGSMPIDHGTMCAFDACIMAPGCTILDIALLASNAGGGTVMEGLLSDAVRAYNHLADIMRAPRRPGEARSLVVNNSWGMFHPSWDFPVGNPGNYSDNPNHPFNRIVGTLEGLGADILFAAGNCGSDCPDGRCQGLAGGIYGANSHPQVTSVAGVDTSRQRVGYSTQGPGRLTRNKPDVCSYTHFAGSGVYSADGGTSAATPVLTGLVAAYRSKVSFQPGNPAVSPAAVRDLLRSTAQDLGGAGFDFDHGFGVVQGCAIADRLGRLQPARPLCDLAPGLCRPRVVPIDLCRRFPELCEPIIRLPILPRIPRPGDPGPDPVRPGAEAGGFGTLDPGEQGENLEALSREQLVALAYLLGQIDAAGGESGSGPVPQAPPSGGAKCNCG